MRNVVAYGAQVNTRYVPNDGSLLPVSSEFSRLQSTFVLTSGVPTDISPANRTFTQGGTVTNVDLLGTDYLRDKSLSATAHNFTSPNGAKVSNADGGHIDLTTANQFLSTPANANLGLGTADWTIMYWLKYNGSPSKVNVHFGWSGGIEVYAYHHFTIRINIAGTVHASGSTAGVDLLWHHYVWAREGNNLRVFIDGALVLTVDVTGRNFPNPTTSVSFGRFGDSNNSSWAPLAFYQDILYQKGTALYTATGFTPPVRGKYRPTSAATFFLNQRDFRGDPSVTESVLNLARASSQFVSTSEGSSLKTNGTDSFAEVSGPHTGWDMGTNVFTVDFWYRPNNTTSTADVITTRNVAGYASFAVLQVSTELRLYVSAGSAWNVGYFNMGTTVANTWAHYAFQREAGNVWRGFKNGVLISTETQSFTPMTPATLRIGGAFPPDRISNGFVDEVRISKGIARYPSTGFTPPTAPYTKDNGDDAFTTFLWHADNFGSNEGAGRVNESTITPFGGAVLDDTVKQFWGFDLSEDKEWCIDGWFRMSSISTQQYLLGKRALGAGANLWFLRYQHSNNKLLFLFVTNLGAQHTLEADTTITDGAWHHIAICRDKFSQTVLKMYIDGVLDKSMFGHRLAPAQDTTLSFGRAGTHTNDYLDGNLARWRFTLGSPVYRGFESFAPPIGVSTANCVKWTDGNWRGVANDPVGSTSYAILDELPRMLYMEQFYFSAWVRIRDTTDELYCYSETFDEFAGNCFIGTNARKLRIYLRDSAGAVKFSPSSTHDIADGKAHFIQVYRNGTTLYFKVDGNAWESNTSTAGVLSGTWIRVTVGAMRRNTITASNVDMIWDIRRAPGSINPSSTTLVPLNEGTGTAVSAYGTSNITMPNSVVNGSTTWWQYEVCNPATNNDLNWINTNINLREKGAATFLPNPNGDADIQTATTWTNATTLTITSQAAAHNGTTVFTSEKELGKMVIYNTAQTGAARDAALRYVGR